jgi:predicted TPR repeat methyltransferase
MNSQVATAMSAAVQSHQSGNLVAAEQGYRSVLRLAPGHSDALMLLGVLLFNQGRVADGEHSLRESVKHQPANAQAWMHLGNILLNRNDLQSARGAFEAATRAAPAMALAWLNLGGCLWRLEQAPEAEVAMRNVTRLDPSYEVAFQILTLLLNRQGRVAEMAEVYRQWHTHHPANPLPKHMLAATTGVDIPTRAAPDYVQRHFDRLALDFDQHLGALGYRGPELIMEQLRLRLAVDAKLDILDAGCGTGLCGPLLRPLARRLSGADLSSGMIGKAQARAVYDELIVQDISEFMRSRPRSFDVVVCIETLNYFGELDEPLQAAHACLRTGGLIALTVESLEGDARYRLEPHGRYLHSHTYLQQALAAAGFLDVDSHAHVLRQERGVDVLSYICLARAA